MTVCSLHLGKYETAGPDDLEILHRPRYPTPLVTASKYILLSEDSDEDDDEQGDRDCPSSPPTRKKSPREDESQSTSQSESDTTSTEKEGESEDEISSSASDTKTKIHYSAGRRYLHHDIWKGMPAEKVDQIPYDIDGLQKYRLKFDINKRMESSHDGRKWKRYVPSKRRGHKGIRRLANCSGSYRCDNVHCDFLEEYGHPNRHHFKLKDDGAKCDHCGSDGVFVKCNARKIWEFDDTRKLVTVYHYGDHSCLPAPKRNTETNKVVTDMFKKNPKLKPSQVSVNCVVEAISDDKNWDEIDAVTENVADERNHRNLKKKATREMNPHGHSFEAVGILKKKTDERDPHLIHKINDRSLNLKPSYVFKTSTFKANLCLSMNRNGDKLLCKEYCHFDGKVNRCPGYTTLTASVYHPTLKKMIKLAVMEAEGEGEENVAIFWQELDEVIKKVSGNSEATFNPYGFMLDEAGGLWNAIRKHFSDEVLKNSVSCEFHYMQSVNRHSSSLVDDNGKRRYKKLAKQLMDSASPAAYFETMNVIENFIQQQKDANKKLRDWLHWWDSRRIHWARAFKSDLLTPSSNLSEAVNASYAHKGSCSISLVRAAYEDTADSMLIEKQWKQYGAGAKTCGTGPSNSKRVAREMAKQRKEAARLVEEINILDTAGKHQEQDAVETAYQECQIDPTCSFEPRTNSGSRKSKRGRPRKHRVSVYDYSDTESDDEEQVGGKDKRPGRLRKKPSKAFQKSLEKATAQKNKLKVESVREKGNSFEVIIRSKSTVHWENGRRDQWNRYTCMISRTPTCDCPYFLGKEGQICKHIIWTLLNLFKIREGNSLLFQVAFTEREFALLKTNAAQHIPEEIRFSEGEQTSSTQPQAHYGQSQTSSTQPQGQSQTSSTQQQAHYGQSQPSMVLPRFPVPAPGAFWIYVLSLCPAQVSVCFGCGAALKPGGSIPLPPLDLVVVGNMAREFRKDGQVMRKQGNVYFHCQIQCISRRQPYFVPSICFLPPAVRALLSEQHIMFLRDSLGIVV